MLKFRLGLCAALFVALAAGCYKNAFAPGSISGQVTYKNGPVPAGSIVFHVAGKGPYGASLKSDGTYEITDVPSAENVKVTIDTESYNPKKKARAYANPAAAKLDAEMKKAMERMGAPIKQSPGEYRQIPAKYGKVETTPLQVAVEAGSQTHNFNLTD